MQLRREKIALLCGVRWEQQKPVRLPQRLVQKKLLGKGQALQAIVASIAHSGRMLYRCPNRFVNSRLGMAVKGVDAVALNPPATILGGQEAFLSPPGKGSLGRGYFIFTIAVPGNSPVTVCSQYA
jgi:hypothetical protein